MIRSPLCASAALLALTSPAAAQDAASGAAASQPAPGADEPAPAAARAAEPGQIVVTADRLRGQIDAAQAPVAVYNEDDVAALGAGSLAEVLARVAPQTGSGRGRGSGQPVILVNGQRIANFREMRGFPPEAIKRMEVLPEEVALRYGYPASSRVINFILKDNFRSHTAEARVGMPTRGGFATWQAEGTLLRISGPSRFSVTATADDTSPLYESERGVVQTAAPVAGAPDPAAYRTLIADSRNLGLNLGWARGLGKDGKGGQLSLTGSVTRGDTRSGSGLDARLAPIGRIGRSTEVAAGAALNTAIGSWQAALTADGTLGQTRTVIDRFAGTGQDLSTSDTRRLSTLATLTGSALRLPAGDLSTTLKAGFVAGSIDSRDTRSAQATHLARQTASAGINLVVPVTSRRENALGAVGDITFNASLGYDHVSDFGAVTDWSAGITWAPTDALNLQATYLVNDVAPSLSQLGNPLTVSFNVPVYDLSLGQTVLATVTGGGNPLLTKERQRDIKLSANWQLPFLQGSGVLVEWFRNRSTDISAAFPVLTPAIEAAFPGRVVRDPASGRITALDYRPVTLARQDSERLRWGVNLNGPIGLAGDGGMFGMMGGGGQRAGGARGSGAGGGGGRRGGGMMAAMGGGGQGRWMAGLYHTVQFANTVLVSPGGPLLDLLDGDALSGGGVPRHALEFNAGAFHKGFGLFVQGSWNAPTRLRASGLPNSTDLRFGALAQVRLNLFADVGRMPPLVKRAKWLKGTRIGIGIDNLFDSRQRVTDAAGTVPLSYQPDYLDPRGRVITLVLRKVF